LQTAIFAAFQESISEGFLYELPNLGYYNSKGQLLRAQPRCDFNDAALPIGASVFARLVEKKLPRFSSN
jgi:hypothetical protein